MDPLDIIFGLEEDLYNEGYDLGVADGIHAGLVEGKVFGLEKGFEKSLELGRLHGRAKVWIERLPPASTKTSFSHSDEVGERIEEATSKKATADRTNSLRSLPGNARLRRHIESLHAMTDPTTVSKENSDEAVAEFDDRLMRAAVKAKVIANIAAEPLDLPDKKSVPDSITANNSIEESKGLSARH